MAFLHLGAIAFDVNSSFCTSWANTNIRKERREGREKSGKSEEMEEREQMEDREERTEKQRNIPRTATRTAFVTLIIFAFGKLISRERVRNERSYKIMPNGPALLLPICRYGLFHIHAAALLVAQEMNMVGLVVRGACCAA